MKTTSDNGTEQTPVDAQYVQTVNGKRYTLWPAIVANKGRYIGGDLEEFDGVCGKAMAKIVDIRFEPNGKDSAMLSVVGDKFTWSADVQFISVGAEMNEPEWLYFYTMWGDRARIRSKSGEKVVCLS